MASIKSCLRWGAAITAAVPIGLVSLAASAQTNPNSTTLPNGANLSVEIDDPLQDMEFKVPAASGPGGTIDVPVEGEASVGQGVPNIHITFVVDVSGSTTASCGVGALNVLDCEKQAVLNVLADPNITSVLDIGVTIFGDMGASADMALAVGDQPLTGNLADVTTVVNSISNGVSPTFGQVAQFTLKFGGGGTDFAAGLLAAQNSATGMASTAATKRVFFLSDGISGQDVPAFLAALQPYIDEGVVIDSFAVGGGSACVPPSPPFPPNLTVTLQEMADATGGTCTELPDPADILVALPNLIQTTLDGVQVAVDGSDVPTNTNPPLAADGPITALYDALPNLGIGDFNVTATATGSDTSPTGSMVPVTADVDIHLLQLTAAPPNASNELGVDQAHAVNGAILGGTGPDRNIDFLVGGQNAATANPGNGSSLATPGGAAVSFNYTVPASCDSLGQDTITVSTSIAGMTDSIVLTKDWVDTGEPTVTASLVCLADDDDDDDDDAGGGSCGDEGRLRIEFSASDLVDADPGVTAVLEVPGLADIPVTNGQIIEFEFDDDTEVEFEDGILEIEGQALTLRATATDCGGNVAEATDSLVAVDDDDDDD